MLQMPECERDETSRSGVFEVTVGDSTTEAPFMHFMDVAGVQHEAHRRVLVVSTPPAG